MIEQPDIQLDASAYDFDPSYGYSLSQLLSIVPPRPPAGYQEFWHSCYKAALAMQPQLQLYQVATTDDWRVFEISYISTDQLTIRGWLLLPTRHDVKRGFIVSHGYGGRTAPDLGLPFKDAAILFPCCRGLPMSTQTGIASDAYGHVLHGIEHKDSYILKGCIEDIWLAVSALLNFLPQLTGHLGYLGTSFGGGIGALALAFEPRIARAHLNVPSFGHHSLRMRLPTWGSAHSVQQYYLKHRKATLKVLKFYDAAIAAQFLIQPTHCACALFDPCVAPPGQFAIYNAIPGRKQLYILQAGHHDYPEQAHQQAELNAELQSFFAPLCG